MSEAMTENLMPEFRFALKAQVAMAGYKSISELARQVGVTPSRISRMVTGYEFPSVDLQNGIARALGVDVRQLGRLL
jgi:transcriptional regulator with XRE-family HTH domain